jgi:hypothetical protein
MNWLNEEPSRLPYILFTKTCLIDECIKKFGGKK